MAAALEDCGWYVIDNMPPSLLASVADTVGSSGSPPQRVALVVGRGGGARVGDVLESVGLLRQAGNEVDVLYLDAPDEVLVTRFEGTRRRHPVSSSDPGITVEEAIQGERRMLAPVRDGATAVMDTGQLNVNQLRARTIALFGPESGDSMQITIISFGFKYGLPLDADLVFDCRFMPNPYWVAGLREQTGLDADVRRFVLEPDEAEAFLRSVQGLVEMTIPLYRREGRSYLTIGIGCTGGQHRSVAIAAELAGRLTSSKWEVSALHRDMSR